MEAKNGSKVCECPKCKSPMRYLKLFNNHLNTVSHYSYLAYYTCRKQRRILPYYLYTRIIFGLCHGTFTYWWADVAALGTFTEQWLESTDIQTYP